MEPVTLIVTALATGAAAALKPAAEDAIKVGYEGLKSLLQRKFGQVELKALEQKPESKPKRDSVAEDLTAVGADQDREVLGAAQALLQLIGSCSPQTAAAIGVDLELVRVGGSINIENVISDGAGVRANDVQASADLNIKGIRAGVQGHSDPNSPRQ